MQVNISFQGVAEVLPEEPVLITRNMLYVDIYVRFWCERFIEIRAEKEDPLHV